MANISVTKNQEAPSVASSRAWDPLRAMRDMLRFDPFNDAFAYSLPSLFGRDANGGFTPAFDVKETADGFTFSADLPGVKDTDLEVKLSPNRITISGRREAEKTENTDTYYAYERAFGSFTRSFTLPDGIDADRVHAELKGGVLNLFVPRKPEATAKKVDIKSA